MLSLSRLGGLAFLVAGAVESEQCRQVILQPYYNYANAVSYLQARSLLWETNICYHRNEGVGCSDRPYTEISAAAVCFETFWF